MQLCTLGEVIGAAVGKRSRDHRRSRRRLVTGFRARTKRRLSTWSHSWRRAWSTGWRQCRWSRPGRWYFWGVGTVAKPVLPSAPAFRYQSSLKNSLVLSYVLYAFWQVFAKNLSGVRIAIEWINRDLSDPSFVKLYWKESHVAHNRIKEATNHQLSTIKYQISNIN